MEQLERVQKRLELYYKAEEAILTGQEYAIGTKRLRRADLEDVLQFPVWLCLRHPILQLLEDAR